MSAITERPASGSIAREAAYQYIRNKIIHLELRPGEAISDRGLAEELEMSRTPVREALLLLSSVNMVVLKPQSGTFVTPIDMQRVEVEQFTRFAVEKEILTRAARDPQSSFETLQQQYQENLRFYHFYAEESMQRSTWKKQLLELDNSFHSLAFQAVGLGSAFSHLMKSTQHIERFRSLSLDVDIEDHVYEDHQNISSAVLNGDSQSAVKYLERHMYRYREHLPILLERYPDCFSSSGT